MDRNASVSADILRRILATKREEVAALAGRRALLRARAEAAGAVRPFAAALRRGGGRAAPLRWGRVPSRVPMRRRARVL